jgi:hypothetical protein
MPDTVTDTHSLIWYIEDSPRLGSAAREAFDACWREHHLVRRWHPSFSGCSKRPTWASSRAQPNGFGVLDTAMVETVAFVLEKS